MLRRFPKPTHLITFKWRGFFVFCLLMGVLLSMLAIIKVQHDIRHLETDYYLALQAKIEATEEWGRLTLEHHHLSAPARVGQLAQTKLNMTSEKSKELGNLYTLYLNKPVVSSEYAESPIESNKDTLTDAP